MRFHLSPLFSDHAVLCRGRTLRLFGQAEEGAFLQAELKNAKGAVLCRGETVAQRGRFLLCMDPQEAQTDCTLTVRCGEERVLLRDIAIGDVYLAGGQSNMEWPLCNADEGPGCIATHRSALVRYLNVPRRALQTEEAPLGGAAWQTLCPGSGGDMSAVAYFFAMRMQAVLQIPVGIIDCYWGGTSVACWLSRDALCESAEGKKILADYEEKTRDITMASFMEKNRAFEEGMDAWNRAFAQWKQKEPQWSAGEITRRIGPAPWCPPDGPGSPYRPCGLYETMLAPLAPCALTGVLFYQGETDAGRVARYDLLLCSFIRMLRGLFQHSALPFVIAQLPCWQDASQPSGESWARLRLQQAAVQANTAHTGLAVLLDQGEGDNLHPTRKRIAGERLADETLRLLYNCDTPTAPRVASSAGTTGCLTLRFTLPVRLAADRPDLFALAGADGVYYPADRAECVSDGLRIQSIKVPHPLYARYFWADYSADIPLWGTNGVPVLPFDTLVLNC